MDQNSENEHATIPGDVLVAGAGFLVTAAAWMLFGFLKGEFGASSATTLFFVIAAFHALTGVAIFRRRGMSIPIGVVVAIIGLAVAGFDLQYVLMFTNVVILVLLVLARGNVVVRSD